MPKAMKSSKQFQIDLNNKYGKNVYKLLDKYTGDINRVTIKHKCGKTITPRSAYILSGVAKCPCLHLKNNPEAFVKKPNTGLGGCVKGNIKSSKQFQLDLHTKYGKNVYKLVSEYKGNQEKITVRHHCGIKSTFKAINILVGIAKCPCQHKKNNFRTLESHNLEVKKWWGSEYKCIEYNGAGSGKSLNIYYHSVCKKTFQKTLPQLKATKYCPHCFGKNVEKVNAFSKDEVQTKLNKVFNCNEYLIVDKDYISTKVMTTVKHKCGHVYKVKLQSLLVNVNMCPKCHTKGMGRVKTIKINNKEFKLQGFEELSLKYLIKKHKTYNINTGCSNKIPRFDYTINNKRCRYTPDFYIKSKNLIVETKSIVTLGLGNKEFYIFDEYTFDRNKAKARAVIKKGFRFELHLWDRGKLISLPKDWFNLSKEQVLKIVSSSRRYTLPFMKGKTNAKVSGNKRF